MTATVRVPATSANLGPGFDTLGLALDVWDEVSVAPSAATSVVVTGEGATTVPRDESHLVLRALRRGLAAFGGPDLPIRLQCHNAIPQGRGLGSSAAAICAGLLLARALAGAPPDADLLALAAETEGHPDNVAACLFGGLTISWTAGGRVRALSRDVIGVAPLLLIPPTQSSTEQTRGLLPAQVPHRDAAFTAARAALLVAALTGAPELLVDATEDRLHQPYRAEAMPDSTRLVAEIRAHGMPAVISGAGPSVLALSRDEVETDRVAALTPRGWRFLPTAVTGTGAHLI